MKICSVEKNSHPNPRVLGVCVCGIPCNFCELTAASDRAKHLRQDEHQHGWADDQRQAVGGEAQSRWPGLGQVGLQGDHRGDDWAEEETFRL